MESKHGVARRYTLTSEELRELKVLAELCQERDGIEVRLNWEMLQVRSGNVANDLLYYEEGELVGYLALYSFHAYEVEMTGMVHPDQRRRGIFRMLFALANAELKLRRTSQILMFFDRGSRSGQAFAKAVGASYRNSEYKMQLDPARVPAPQPLDPHLGIRVARPEDARVLAHISARAFQTPEDKSLQADTTKDIFSTKNATYVAELDGQPIGEIRYLDKEEAFIYGFCMLPEQQGHGYGRQTLSWTVSKILAERPRPVLLEVATENAQALSLYQSCGFETARTFDYYEYRVH